MFRGDSAGTQAQSDDRQHCRGEDAGAHERGGGRFGEQIFGRFKIDRIAVMPAMVMRVPVERSNDVSAGDGGIVEVQCTAEGRAISRAELDVLLDLVGDGIVRLLAAQREILASAGVHVL